MPSEALSPPPDDGFPPLAGVHVSLIIPAHNEETRLGPTLREYAEALRDRFASGFEILVVANGCTDGTADVARAAAEAAPEVRLIELQAAVGKGGAVLEGMRAARGGRVLFADADAATSPASLLTLASTLDQFDVVIGSRRLPESVILCRQPLARRLLGEAFAWVVRVLFGLPYLDTQCGAKAFRRDAALRLAAAVTETRWTFDLDLLLTAGALGLRVTERSVVWADQPGSRLRLLPTTAEVLAALWRLKRRAWAPGGAAARPTATLAGECLAAVGGERPSATGFMRLAAPRDADSTEGEPSLAHFGL